MRSVRLVRTATACVFTAGLALGPAGCNKRQIVDRVDPETTINLDYRWTDDDARMTARTMIESLMQSQRLNEWSRENGGKRPVVIVGTVKNDTSDYIDTKLFTKQIERELVNSGRTDIVAARDERGEIRDERLQGRDWSRPETVKRIAYEMGADLMMIGRVGENVQQSLDRKRRVQYYQADMELVDLESNVKVWIESQEVKKTAQRKP